MPARRGRPRRRAAHGGVRTARDSTPCRTGRRGPPNDVTRHGMRLGGAGVTSRPAHPLRSRAGRARAPTASARPTPPPSRPALAVSRAARVRAAMRARSASGKRRDFRLAIGVDAGRTARIAARTTAASRRTRRDRRVHHHAAASLRHRRHARCHARKRTLAQRQAARTIHGDATGSLGRRHDSRRGPRTSTSIRRTGVTGRDTAATARRGTTRSAAARIGGGTRRSPRHPRHVPASSPREST